MGNIEELKKKRKELEYNKRQLERQLENVTEEIERLKNTRFSVNVEGTVTTIPNFFSESSVLAMAKQGNVFFTIEEAEKEMKKRALKFEVEELRKERNGDWKPDWNDITECKYHLAIISGNRVTVTANHYVHSIPEFGSFQKLKDAEFAVKVFGDRILELYAD